MEKIIEEMALELCLFKRESCQDCERKEYCLIHNCAKCFYDLGYRKERQGEWIEYYDDGIEEIAYKCSLCGCEGCYKYMSYCPKCGAKMKGN